MNAFLVHEFSKILRSCIVNMNILYTYKNKHNCITNYVHSTAATFNAITSKQQLYDLISHHL